MRVCVYHLSCGHECVFVHIFVGTYIHIFLNVCVCVGEVFTLDSLFPSLFLSVCVNMEGLGQPL